MFPADVQYLVSLYHLPTTGGSSQAYPGSADVTTTGALLPLDRRDQALEGNDNYQVPYELYLDTSVDVRVGDKAVITVGGVATNFYIKSIFSAPFGGLSHKRCSLSYQE